MPFVPPGPSPRPEAGGHSQRAAPQGPSRQRHTSRWRVRPRKRRRSQANGYALGPVPGVDVMAKRYQGLLNVGTFSRGLLAVSGVICGSSAGAGGGVLSSRLQGGALGGPGHVWVQLGPTLPPREGAVPGSPVQNKMTRIALTGKFACARMCWLCRPVTLSNQSSRPRSRRGAASPCTYQTNVPKAFVRHCPGLVELVPRASSSWPRVSASVSKRRHSKPD
jgi:hypothetical protein